MPSRSASQPDASAHRIRLDKWMWAARFFKTRALSSEAIDLGRVQVNGLRAKPGREVHLGDLIEWRVLAVERSVVVKALSDVRGSATVASALFEETAESLARRAAASERQRLAPEPARSLSQGRPTKRSRRELQALNQPPGSGAAWNDRWSASLDDQ